MLKHLMLFISMLVFAACTPDISSPEIQNAVIQSLTATMWTPTPATPTATPEPNTGRIVDLLNNAMLGADPLGETIDAKFSVIEARIILDDVTQQATILCIHVECEWIYSDSCTPEQTFVVLMHALTKKVLEKIASQLPPTVHTLQMAAFDRMVQTGMVVSSWGDVMDYVAGRISGNQLGSRIIRLAAIP